MVKLNQAFPTKYLSAADLQGREATVTIARAEMESIKTDDGNENKLALYFQGKDKGLICNVTNANSIAEHYGDDTDHWLGKRITLYSTKVQFGAKMVDAIRVKIPTTQEQAPRQNIAAQNDKEFSETDEIPF